MNRHGTQLLTILLVRSRGVQLLAWGPLSGRPRRYYDCQDIERVCERETQQPISTMRTAFNSAETVERCYVSSLAPQRKEQGKR